MEAVSLHVLADLLGSVGVVISTLLLKFFGVVSGDAICSFTISLMILRSVLPLLKSTADDLLLVTPAGKDTRTP